MFCVKCGASIEEGNDFCNKCGSPVSSLAFQESSDALKILEKYRTTTDLYPKFQPVADDAGLGNATRALVFGITGLAVPACLFWLPIVSYILPLISWVVSVIGLINCYLSKKRGCKRRRLKVAYILNIVTFVLSVIAFAIMIIAILIYLIVVLVNDL